MKKLNILLVITMIVLLSSCVTNDDVYYEKWDTKTSFSASVATIQSGFDSEFDTRWDYFCVDATCIFKETNINNDTQTIRTDEYKYFYSEAEERWFREENVDNFLDYFDLSLSDFTYDSEEQNFVANSEVLGDVYTYIRLFVNDDNNVVEERTFFVGFVKYKVQIVYFDYTNIDTIDLPTEYTDIEETYEPDGCPNGE